MTFYHGNNQKDWKINPHQKSRYGFEALFFTPNIELARLYAVHHYRKRQRHEGGCIYSMEMNAQTEPAFDWKSQSTHTPHFKNLICQAATGHLDFLLIKNVIDYPSKELRLLAVSDILVCFNTRWIQGLGVKLVENAIINV